MAKERVKAPEFVPPTDVWLLPKEEVVACLAPKIGDNLEKIIREYKAPEAQVYNLVVAAACSPHVVNGSVVSFIQLQFPRNIFGWVGEREGYSMQFLAGIRDTGGLTNVEALMIKDEEKRERVHRERLILGIINEHNMINEQVAGPIREKLKKKYPSIYKELVLIYVLSYMNILRGMSKAETPDIAVGESLARSEDSREKVAEEFYRMYNRREFYKEAVREGLRTLGLEGLGIEDIIGLDEVGIDHTKVRPWKVTLVAQPTRATVACARVYDALWQGHSYPQGVPVETLEPGGVHTIQDVVAKVIQTLQERDFLRPQAAEYTDFLNKKLYILQGICEKIGLPTFFVSVGVVVCPWGTPGSFNPFRFEPARASALWPGEVVAYPSLYWIVHELIQLHLEAHASTLARHEKPERGLFYPHPIQHIPPFVAWPNIEGMVVAIGDTACEKMGVKTEKVPYAVGVPRWRQQLFGKKGRKSIGDLLGEVCQIPGLTEPRIGVSSIARTLNNIWRIRDEVERLNPEILARDLAAEVNSRSLDAYLNAIGRYKIGSSW